MGDAARIIVILGPTGSGKSALAMALAERIGAEILSVDSMQVYRGMDIGTAKPTESQRQHVRHHLVDVVEPNECFTAARFVELGDRAIADAAQGGMPLIAAGGTPLYYKSLFEGLFAGPPEDAELRRKLRELDGTELHRRLAAADPAAAQRIHPNDAKRLIRALEVHTLTGRPISQWQTEWTEGRMRHEAVWFGIAWEKEALNRRINARVRQMIEAGWVHEVRRLLERYGGLSRTAGEATGYRQIVQHLQGSMPLEEAVEQTKIATRQLARRQTKWFRRFARVQWLKGDDPLEGNLQTVLNGWREQR